MLSTYLCGAVVVSAAAVVFAGGTPAPAFRAGLLWPVVVVSVVQVLLIHLLARVIQARAAQYGSRPLSAITLSSETWGRTTRMVSGSLW